MVRFTDNILRGYIEIGEKQGPFDLALIPIGAYSPRWFMSTIHCSPEDAVRVHEDVKSKRSVSCDGSLLLTNVGGLSGSC